jgi:hypothetical protein
MATMVGEDGTLRAYNPSPGRMRDVEERLKQSLERIWDLEDQLRALSSRVEQVEQHRAAA